MVAEAPFKQAGDIGPTLKLFPGSREVGNRKGPVQPQDTLSRFMREKTLAVFMGDLIVVELIVSS